MIRCPSGRCMTPRAPPVCPSNFWRGITTDVLVVGKSILQNSYYRVQRHLRFHPLHSNIITYEDNNDRRVAGYNRRFCQVRVDFSASWYVLHTLFSCLLHSLYTA
ncbi:hypothetical protein BDR03DRAFT_962447 [Suillus americanus]|nr:hypothetical protein BDR03DRAFT_962447 [Suillus americanus]